MKFSVNIKGIGGEIGRVENIDIVVEYTVEEFVGVVNAYKDLLPAIMEMAKQNSI